MKDEIKEILECLSLIAKNEYVPDELLNDEMCQQLLDYITNLQEERNMFKDSFETMSKNYFEEKSRNEKAIEYIKSLCYIESKNEWFTYGDDLSSEHIVNILKGSDEE